MSTYSYRVRRACSQRLLSGLVARLRPLGLATGEQGFNLDFHAIPHHGDVPVLDAHYVPSRSQRTRSVLTFFAQDHVSAEMVYANADITTTEQAREIIAFVDYWQAATGTDPGLLVFDSQLTTYRILDELGARGITWLTLRQRGTNELARLAALPASAWKRHAIDRAGRYRHPHLHQDTITLRASPRRFASSPSPTSAATSHPADNQRPHHAGQRPVRPLRRTDARRPARRLHPRIQPQRTVVQRPAQRRPRRHPDVVAGNLYRDDTDTLHITPEGVTANLTLRSHHPVLIDAGFADLQLPIPWWDAGLCASASHPLTPSGQHQPQSDSCTENRGEHAANNGSQSDSPM